MTNYFLYTILMCFMCLFSTGCVKRYLIGSLTHTLGSGNGEVFSQDEDPELIKEALPFALKLFETMLQANPQDAALLQLCGKSYALYASAFIQIPADTISDLHIEKKQKELQRAKKLFLRSRHYCLSALEARHKGFITLIESDSIEKAMQMTSQIDTTVLYWTAVSWLCAFTVDKFDMNLAVSLPKPIACMQRLKTLNESFGNGSVHDFFVTYYGSLPPSMGGSSQKAREHFQKSIALSKGLSATPFVALASSVCVNEQNSQEFTNLLTQACAIDVSKPSTNRLTNIIMQTKAHWLLQHRDNFFLPEEPSNPDSTEQSAIPKK